MPITKTKTRSAVTGRQLGRAARRAQKKNSEAVEEYLDAVEATKTLDDLTFLQTGRGLTIARVVKALGAGRLEVQLPDGSSANLMIAGAVKFKGAAATKGDRANCMSVSDFVVIRGEQAAGKMGRGTATRIQTVFEKHRLPVAASFFAGTGAAADSDVDDCIEWEAVADSMAGEDDGVDVDAI